MNLSDCKTPAEVHRLAIALGKDPKKLIDEWIFFKNQAEVNKIKKQEADKEFDFEQKVRTKLKEVPKKERLEIYDWIKREYDKKLIQKKFRITCKVRAWIKIWGERQEKIEEKRKYELKILKLYAKHRLSKEEACYLLGVGKWQIKKKMEKYNLKRVCRETKLDKAVKLLDSGAIPEELKFHGINKSTITQAKKVAGIPLDTRGRKRKMGTISLKNCKTPVEVHKLALSLGKDPKKMIDEWVLLKRADCSLFKEKEEKRVVVKKSKTKTKTKTKTKQKPKYLYLKNVPKKLRWEVYDFVKLGYNKKYIKAKFSISGEVLLKIVNYCERKEAGTRKEKYQKSVLKAWTKGRIDKPTALKLLDCNEKYIYVLMRKYGLKNKRLGRYEAALVLLQNGYTPALLRQAGFGWNLIYKAKGRVRGEERKVIGGVKCV